MYPPAKSTDPASKVLPSIGSLCGSVCHLLCVTTTVMKTIRCCCGISAILVPFINIMIYLPKHDAAQPHREKHAQPEPTNKPPPPDV